MYPSSPDNYGASDSFCALLCLHPGISSPPLLVVATAAGTVYHCIALARDPEGEDARSQVRHARQHALMQNVCYLNVLSLEIVASF